MITYNVDDVRMPKFAHRLVSGWIKQTAATYGKRVGELAYIFTSDPKLLDINRQYLGHDYFTDIITFDYTEDDLLSGDVFISIDTVRKNAEEYGVTFQNELMRVIIHGLLHLTGQNDKTDTEFDEMKQKENAALALLPEDATK